MVFNEDSRVKIPVILHLVRLGYDYLSLKEQTWDLETNIFPEIFTQSIAKINPSIEPGDINRLLEDIKLELDNEDLGHAFFKKLTDRSNTKVIDFENFNNNSFHVVTELTYKNGDDEFRPDITLLINGMPLVFIEVKKPNNREGIIAERNRIKQRFSNSRFRRFINITQFMIFSNNMEYDDTDPEPIQGAFYASCSYTEPKFNYFREEEVLNLTALLKPLDDKQELKVLKDNNLEVIRTNPDFVTNKDHNRPTNRICTSLLSKPRLEFILRYALTYVQERKGLEKHIMRYPQLFATKAIAQTLDKGIKNGIIWHTQGSGKTALAYYNVGHLTDYFQKKNIVPKFYFIVDRIDLLRQAKLEFTARGLKVHTIISREKFARDIKSTTVIHNDSGMPEITVVNIHKFKNDPDVVSSNDYDLNVQRIYFLDEVHRSYNPKGSFLANLKESDRNAIKIGLTGTPLLGDDYNSKSLFGGYIHKYYYNASIADGYTLRLIREEIETNYKIALQKALEEVEVQLGVVKRENIYAHKNFVEPMLDYIIQDFEKSRGVFNDNSIGGMVICDSSSQAKQMYKLFQKKYALNKQEVQGNNSQYALSNEEELVKVLPKAAEEIAHYEVDKEESNDIKQSNEKLSSAKQARKVKTAGLILHDVGTKDELKNWVDDYKDGKLDFLFVYNMLLTGFDAKRLKKLYLGRIIYKHNLLQALTRVNRTYKNFHYGYVVDFADISKEFEQTNEAYFKELQDELGDEMEHYSQLFKSQEEIAQDIEHIKDALFRFDIENAEVFSQQIVEVEDRQVLLNLKKVLIDAKSLYNIIRMQGDYDFLGALDFTVLNKLLIETNNRLHMLNLKQSLEQGIDTGNLINLALEDVVFTFIKKGENELVLADELKNTLQQTRQALVDNFDQQDPKFVTLKEELERLFKKKKLSEVTQQDMEVNIDLLKKIHKKGKELNRQNNQLRQKYQGDVKYARIHKRLQEQGGFSASERAIYKALRDIKHDADEQVLNNSNILDNESYFENQMMPLVIHRFMKEQKIHLNPEASRFINHLVVNEYLKEFNGGAL